ncbi:hypothetical protein ONZ45_g5031 [Pleurotus djamor]|nr:hypothetical protein ONZ45_g5031 [Pleurotus djamor]
MEVLRKPRVLLDFDVQSFLQVQRKLVFLSNEFIPMGWKEMTQDGDECPAIGRDDQTIRVTYHNPRDVLRLLIGEIKELTLNLPPSYLVGSMHNLTDIAAQKLIDSEQHKSAILALQNRRNTDCAIAHIPDTLLASIFAEIRGDPSDEIDSKRWHRVNLVCSHWRAVALTDPSLWSNIKVKNRNMSPKAMSWTLEKLKRAAMVPLTVNYYVSRLGDNAYDPSLSITNILPSRNLRSLNILSADPDHTQNALDCILQRDTQASKTLLALSIRLVLDPFRRLSTLGTCKEFPNLRSLTLSYMPTPASLPSLPRLTHLRFTDAPKIAVSRLLQAVSKTPSIEDISIFGALVDDRDSLSTVSLPHLASLSVKFAQSTNCPYHLFEHLQFPASTSVTIKFDENLSNNEPWDMSDVRYAISLFAGWLDRLPCDALEVVASATTHHHLNIALRSPSRKLFISFPPSSSIPSDVLRMLPFGQFSLLIINLDGASTDLHGMAIDLMVIYLPKLNNLRDLSITTRNISTKLIDPLRMRRHPDGTKDLPNPNLKILQGNFLDEDIPKLEGLVFEREAYDAPLEKLWFTKAITEKAKKRAQFPGSVECIFVS